MNIATAKMTRWVERKPGNGADKKHVVLFGNIVGGFCRRTYAYEFRTAKEAADAAVYLSGQDPKNENLPTPFGPDMAERFGAIKIEEP